MTPITAGVVATYTCDRGYDLGGGNVIRTCMDSGDGGGGVFGGVDPVCQRELLSLNTQHCWHSGPPLYLAHRILIAAMILFYDDYYYCYFSLTSVSEWFSHFGTSLGKVLTQARAHVPEAI